MDEYVDIFENSDSELYEDSETHPSAPTRQNSLSKMKQRVSHTEYLAPYLLLMFIIYIIVCVNAMFK